MPAERGGFRRRTAAGAKAEAVDKASEAPRLRSSTQRRPGNFKFGKTDLPDEAKARLDEMITQIKADPKGAYFEIEGHHR
jgi:outer membrane protein OmpA-like peptidoglycan-associated protein